MEKKTLSDGKNKLLDILARSGAGTEFIDDRRIIIIKENVIRGLDLNNLGLTIIPDLASDACLTLLAK